MDAPHRISQLTLTRFTHWKIVVRCTRKWFTKDLNGTPLSIEVVLMDMQGSRIHASVSKSLINTFDENIREGLAYVVKNFEVIASPAINPILDNSRMIIFLEDTSITIAVDLEIPLSPYKFIPLEKITEASYPDTCSLFDVIEHVVDIDYTNMDGDSNGGDAYIRFVICNVNFTEINFLLFGTFSNVIKGCVDTFKEDIFYQPIIIVNFCSTTKYKGEFVIRNISDATRVLFYHHVEEAIAYRKKLTEYRAHINVEWCNRSRCIKYLFKYVHKGNDRTTAVFYKSHQKDQAGKVVDEIKQYIDCRFVSASEATWRLFGFEMHFNQPSVIRLIFHLKGKQNIVYKGSSSTAEVKEKHAERDTMFTAWMKANATYPSVASQLTYAEFPKYFVWDDTKKVWRPRQRGTSVGRLSYVYPGPREEYFLRILLNVVRGCKSYDDILEYNGDRYKTFQQACYARGLLDDDNEYSDAIKEASFGGSENMLRCLFVNLLTSDSLTSPEIVWKNSKQYLSADQLGKYRDEIGNPDVNLTEDEILNRCLNDIEDIMRKKGRSLKEYHTLPYPTSVDTSYVHNQLIAEELAYDRITMEQEHDKLHSALNEEQMIAYRSIMESIYSGIGQVYFLYGYGGTGKTYVWKMLSAAVRSRGDIVLNVASSGIASLLLPGGRTAHSKFSIPLVLTEESTCNIKQRSDLSKLILKVKLIIWDEAPMMHRNCFEALDRTIRDIMRAHSPGAENLPFGGKVIVFGGDFRQILPVIPKGTRQDIVHASINSSKIWSDCKVLRLTQNMRLQNTGDANDYRVLKEFSTWLSAVGDGTFGDENDGEVQIEIPEEFLVTNSDNFIESMVQATYPSFHDRIDDIDFLQGRAILAPTLDEVDSINEYMVSMHNTDEMIYLSSDSVALSDKGDNMFEQMHSVEFLNTIKCSGLPNHQLKLKVGVPIMLLRNMDPSVGLCNGTRLVITKLGKYVIEAKILGGKTSGHLVYIPRISLSLSDQKLPFTFQRRQFPVMISYAMSINKSQGQSLSNVGIFLRKPVFTHGQLYVALSRVTNKAGLKLLLCDDSGKLTNRTSNVVYKEVFQNL